MTLYFNKLYHQNMCVYQYMTWYFNTLIPSKHECLQIYDVVFEHTYTIKT